MASTFAISNLRNSTSKHRHASISKNELFRPSLGMMLSGCVTLLLIAKTPVTEREKNISALVLAARKNDLIEVKKLIAIGEDPKTRTSHGWSALSYALDYENLEMIEELVRAGVDPNATLRTQKHGFSTPISFGLYSANILRILIRYGVRFKSETGERYLQREVLSDAVWIRYSLLKEYMDETPKPSRQAEWKLSVLKENQEVISLLLASGACPARAFYSGIAPVKERLRSLDDATLNRVVSEAESNSNCSTSLGQVVH